MRRPDMWAFLLLLVLLSLASAAGCTGSIGSAAPGGPGSGGGGWGSGGNGGEPGLAACGPDMAPAPIRRLSHAELNATIADLFPGLALAPLALAPDPESGGFANRATLLNPTALLVEQYSAGAAAVAEKAAADLTRVLPCTPTASTEVACGAAFVEAFGGRAFRRPLGDAEKKVYTDFLNAKRTAVGFKGAVQLTIEAMLQAPPFLYRAELGDPATAAAGRVRLTPYELASRLSYFLWGSMPDQALFDAAAANLLATPADVEAQARRMIADDKIRRMMVEYHRQWLDLDRLDREVKDATLFPTYTPALKAAMREESNRFVESTMVDGDGTIASFLADGTTFVNAELAAHYGVPAPQSGWARVTLDPGQRAGFLTRANFLASHAHATSGSPPLRAVFIMRRLLCQSLPPPPNDADLTPPQPKAGDGPKTNRQLFAARTAGGCQACHLAIDGLGFGLERYDAIGRYRTTDNGLPVDASGMITGGDAAGTFDGGVELSQRLAGSADVRLCATTKWYEYAMGRDKLPSDDCRIAFMERALAAAGGDVREMLVALVTSGDFVTRPAVNP
jgi:hypothetical protein